MQKEQFEWSESGLRLLADIEQEIANSGGAAKVIDILEIENVKSFIKQRSIVQWQPFEIRYLIKNYHVKSHAKIGKYLGRSYNAIKCKVTHLHEKAILEYKRGVKCHPVK